jgi:hypothetical protein
MDFQRVESIRTRRRQQPAGEQLERGAPIHLVQASWVIASVATSAVCRRIGSHRLRGMIRGADPRVHVSHKGQEGCERDG